MPRPQKISDHELREMLAAGLGPTQIARRKGMNHGSVSQRCKALGLRRQPPAVQIAVTIAADDFRHLEDMARSAGMTVTDLARSLLAAIVEDDTAMHGRSAA